MSQYQIINYQDPFYKEVQGLQLIVDDHQQAVIVEKDSNTSLVFQVRGPLDLDKGRNIVMGMLDLLVHYDRMAAKRQKR